MSTPSALPDAPSAARWMRQARRWFVAALIGWLPGALLAVHLSGLIFFLNPDLPFRAGSVLELALRCSLLFGTVSALSVAALARGRPSRAWRLLPWALTLALAVAAILDGAQAAHFAYYLSPAVNTRLIKTALWLAVGALAAFYTALLHSLQRRRYGWKSRLAFALVSLLSIVAMVERREALRVLRPAGATRSTALATVGEGGERRALIVGVDTATLDAILPLVGQGRLPFLARQLREGAYGRLSSLTPVRREPLWMTLATGTYPYKHRVLANRALRIDFLTEETWFALTPAGVGFYEWSPGLGRQERLTHFHNASLPLWEILPRLGIPAGQVGWPGSAPVSQEPVFSVADVFFERGIVDEAVWPQELAGRARLFRVDRKDVQQRAPLPSIDLEDALTEDRWRQSLSLFLIADHREVGALFVFLPGLRRPSARYFGGFAAAQFAADSSADSRQAAEAVAAYLDRVDTELRELWGRFEPEVFALVSAYGVEGPGPWSRLWIAASRERALRGRTDNAPDGMIILSGRGVRAGTLLTGAGIADVAPTLLYALDLPVARDLDGKVMTAAFTKEILASRPVTFLPSYQGLPPVGGRPGSRR